MKDDGTELSGWPKEVTDEGYGIDFAAADFNNDHKMEVVAVFYPYIIFLTEDGISWREDIDCVSVAIGDIDTNDSSPEIVALNREGDIHIYKADGTELDGWPKRIDPNVIQFEGLTLGDVDNDGHLEIVVCTNKVDYGDDFYPIPAVNYIYVLRNDGTVVNGWPFTVTNYGFFTAPSLADLNNDGKVEIIVGENNYDSSMDSSLYVLKNDGQPYPGWPIQVGEEKADCVLGQSIVGSIDSEEGIAIIAPSKYRNRLYGYKSSGISLPYWPKIGHWAHFAGAETPFLSDIDGDGKIELIAAMGIDTGAGRTPSEIFVWDLEAEAMPINAPWPMFQHDPQHTGCYNNPPVLQRIGDKKINEGQTLTFAISATDSDGDVLIYSADSLPFGATFNNQSFNWAPTYSQAGTYSVTFTVSDGQLSDSETVTITVNNVNRPPVLSPIGDKKAKEGQILRFLVFAQDPDLDPLKMKAYPLPEGARFRPYNGPHTPETVVYEFIWKPAFTQAGKYEITFTASDRKLSDSEIITIEVMDISKRGR